MGQNNVVDVTEITKTKTPPDLGRRGTTSKRSEKKPAGTDEKDVRRGVLRNT